MKTRFIIGVILATLMGTMLYLGSWPLKITLYVFLAMAVYEVWQAFHHAGLHLSRSALIFYVLLLPVAIVAALYLLWRIARNLEKPPKLTEEVKIVRKSLSEMLKENRTRCKMTQEFVAESIGVSRQAVSKWENGTSEPNTSNLMALARLYGIPAEDLLKGVESALEAEGK